MFKKRKDELKTSLTDNVYQYAEEENQAAEGGPLLDWPLPGLDIFLSELKSITLLKKWIGEK